MQPVEPYHIPALLEPSLEGLAIHPGGVYVDCTLGGGGHSRAILSRLDARAGGRLLSFDQDSDAIARVGDDADFAGNGAFTAVWGNFRYLRNFLRYYGADAVDGILADLGVSFHHFDDPTRGFSFRWQGPLDMRMNHLAATDAATLVNNAGAERLETIFR
ncbi:MAG: 16S rRNA (cytosine(1402)-N(4))-methyltransferase, partial [Muribaculaceae bacterium]|nr:16S rRNA (cytosine(1402)-N(4))-methyltransferase [Muribaculaceae bacterium]